MSEPQQFIWYLLCVVTDPSLHPDLVVIEAGAPRATPLPTPDRCPQCLPSTSGWPWTSTAARPTPALGFTPPRRWGPAPTSTRTNQGQRLPRAGGGLRRGGRPTRRTAPAGTPSGFNHGPPLLGSARLRPRPGPAPGPPARRPSVAVRPAKL